METSVPKVRFTMEYERDCNLVLEEMWARGFELLLAERLGLVCPCPPFITFYVTGENMQIWEHHEALQWFKDRLLERNQQDSSFMSSVIHDYEQKIAQIEPFWVKGPSADRESIAKYLDLASRTFLLFTIWYYTGTDERTPELTRDLVMGVRNKDEFFAKSDMYVKECIVALGGRRELANLVLAGECPDLPDERVLAERAKGGTVSVDGKERFFGSLKDFARLHPEYEFVGLHDERIVQVDEFRGQSAFRGLVRGTVRVCKNYTQMLEVKEGDILVSPMTTPDFLPAMKKAAAFVTDEGGITCHAGIVAREMHKPCVIGTKIATKVLKDGDEVEVDADKGIVKVLKRS